MKGQPGIAGGLVWIQLDQILTTTLGRSVGVWIDCSGMTVFPTDGRRTMVSILEMPVTQSPILTTTAGIWIEMVSSYQTHLLQPLLGERRLATMRNIWCILTMDPVKPGVRGTASTSHGGPVLFFDQSTNTPLVDGAVHSILKDADQERILVGSKYGITALDPFGDVSSTHELRAGLEMTSMIGWSSSETSDFMIIGTNQGVHCISMENGLPIMSSVSESKIGRVINMLELNTGGDNLDLLSSGKIRHGHSVSQIKDKRRLLEWWPIHRNKLPSPQYGANRNPIGCRSFSQ